MRKSKNKSIFNEKSEKKRIFAKIKKYKVETRKVNIIFTTDIHGNYFPYDFRHDQWGKGSLQRVHGFVAQQVRRHTGSTILIDGGQPVYDYILVLC